MRGLAIGTATLGIMAAATFELAGTAAAAPTGGSNAADAVNQLQAQGYGLSGTNSAGKPLTPAQAGTVYVTVACDYE
jgi:hypothetical protein